MTEEATVLRYPGVTAATEPAKPAVIMAGSGATLTYGELDTFAWRMARALRRLGLRPGDHVAFMIENRLEATAIQWGAHYAGLYYTFISTRLTPPEVAYIVSDCGARVLIVTAATAAGISAADPSVTVLSVGGPVAGLASLEELTAAEQPEPIPGALEGVDMLYSSGTTGRPKGVKPPMTGLPLGSSLLVGDLAVAMVGLGADSVYLSPAPYYHAAPSRFVLATTGLGGTAVVMERFDPEAALRAIDEHGVTHSQWVPTMFLRMLRLPAEVKARYSLASHRGVLHAAAPCPPKIKRAMIDWWGPIIHEYYAGTEGTGMTHCSSEQWLAHPGTVGQPIFGMVRILDDDGRELPVGEVGGVYFESDRSFEYHNDPGKTAGAYARPGLATLGDVGRIDADGFLYLTDRKANMIISGGVNIYPQEAENLLITHPAVIDVAVIGVPNEEWGEEVRAVVQPADGVTADGALESELIAFCRGSLSAIKCPRKVDFRADMPREPTGKLLKRKLRDEYWPARPGREARV